MATVYRKKVEELEAVLVDPELGPEAIEAIVLVADGGKLAIEVKGDLAAILALGANGNARREGRACEDLLVQVSVVAGAGFEPATFRL